MGKRWTVATWSQEPGWSKINKRYKDKGERVYLVTEGEGEVLAKYNVTFDIEIHIYDSGCENLIIWRTLEDVIITQSFAEGVEVPGLDEWVDEVTKDYADILYEEELNAVGNLPRCIDKYTISNIRPEEEIKKPKKKVPKMILEQIEYLEELKRASDDVDYRMILQEQIDKFKKQYDIE